MYGLGIYSDGRADRLADGLDVEGELGEGSRTPPTVV